VLLNLASFRFFRFVIQSESSIIRRLIQILSLSLSLFLAPFLNEFGRVTAFQTLSICPHSTSFFHKSPSHHRRLKHFQCCNRDWSSPVSPRSCLLHSPYLLTFATLPKPHSRPALSLCRDLCDPTCSTSALLCSTTITLTLPLFLASALPIELTLVVCSNTLAPSSNTCPASCLDLIHLSRPSVQSITIATPLIQFPVSSFK
jgi:hypothetical protein